MRIIGGQYSGRRLASLGGVRTRPTAERVREALFNMWQERVVGARFWDAYAGTGAMGLEAVSRGAQLAVFTEVDRAALTTLHQNVERLGLTAQVEVWPVSAEEFVTRCLTQGRRFDLIFADPPWRAGVSTMVSQHIGAVLESRGWLVLESRQDTPTLVLGGLSVAWSRRYGDTRLTGYQRILSDRAEV